MNANTELAPANTSRSNAVHQDKNIHSHDLVFVDWEFATSGEPPELRINFAVQQIGAKWARPTAIPSMSKLKKGKGLTEKSNSKGSTPKKPKQTNQTETNPTSQTHKRSLNCIVNIQFQTMSSFWTEKVDTLKNCHLSRTFR